MTVKRPPLALRLLAVLALMLGAVLDVGLMPARGADGQQILVLCSGAGPMQMVADPVTGTLRPAEPAKARAAGCDWAAAQACGLLQVPVAAAPCAVVRKADPFPAEAVWTVGRNVFNPRARGPPPSV